MLTIVDYLLPAKYPDLASFIDQTVTHTTSSNGRLFTSLDSDLEDLLDLGFSGHARSDCWRQLLTEDGLDVIDQFVDDVVVQNIDALRLCDTHDIRINGLVE